MSALVFATLLGALTLSIAHPVGVAASSSTGGDVSTPDASEVDGLEYERSEVTLDGRVLFRVRGWPVYTADERAKAIRRRIEEIAADSSLALDSLRTVEMEDRTRIVAGDHLVAAFIDADGAVDGVSRQLLAERAAIKVKDAIAAYRNDRNPRVLLINTLYALGATAALALVLLTVRRAFRKLDALAQRRLRSRIEAFEAQSHQIVEARQVRQALQGLLKSIYLLALLLLSYIYLHFVFGLYPWTRPLAARLLAIFLDPLQAMGLGLLESLPGIVFVIIVAIVTRYILRLTRLYFESIDRGTVTLARFDREWALPHIQNSSTGVHRFGASGGLPLYSGFELRSLQGRLDISRPGSVVRLFLGDRQFDGGLYHDLSARFQDRRSHHRRQSHRGCDREAAHGDAPAYDQK